MNFEIKVPAAEAKRAVEEFVESKVIGQVSASVKTVHKDGSMTLLVTPATPMTAAERVQLDEA